MYLSYQQVSVADSVLTVTSFTIPAKATHAALQADVGAIRYTMDDTTSPSTSAGMLFKLTDLPKEFLIEDVRRIKIIRDGTTSAKLNVHYFAGRDI